MNAMLDALNSATLPRGSVAEFKASSIAFIHDAHWNFGRKVRIDEDHVSELKAGRLDHCLYAVECHVDFSCGILRSPASHGIAASHAGDEQPVVGEDARGSGLIRVVVWRMDGGEFCQTANCDCTNLYGRLGNLGNTQNGPGRRNLAKVRGEDSIHF